MPKSKYEEGYQEGWDMASSTISMIVVAIVTLTMFCLIFCCFRSAYRRRVRLTKAPKGNLGANKKKKARLKRNDEHENVRVVEKTGQNRRNHQNQPMARMKRLFGIDRATSGAPHCSIEMGDSLADTGYASYNTDEPSTSAWIQHHTERRSTLEQKIQKHAYFNTTKVMDNANPNKPKSTDLEMRSVAVQVVDAWEHWILQLGIDIPTKISMRLARLGEIFDRNTLEFDKLLADLLQTEIDGDEVDNHTKAELLYKCSHMYLSFGKFEKAIEVAIQGIDLLQEPSNADDVTQVTLVKLFCSAGEASMEPGTIAYYFERAKRFFHSLPDSTPEHDDLDLRVETLKLHLSRFTRSQQTGNSIVQSICSDGGVLKLNDGTIFFPKNSISKETLLHAATDVGPVHSPSGKIPITPMLRFSPNMQLNVPATIKIKTWFSSTHPVPVQIYVKDDENAEWEELPQNSQVRLCGNNQIEFETSKFCVFCAFYNADQVANVSFHVACLLFYDARRKFLTNRIVPACDTYIDATNQKMRRFDSVCSINPEFEVRVGHNIVVRLENIEDTQPRDPITLEARITMSFVERQNHDAMDFRLPRNCTGFVDFDHVVTQHGGQEVIAGPIRHTQDRILLDGGGAPGSYGQQFNIGAVHAHQGVDIGGSGNFVDNHVMNVEPPQQQLLYNLD